MVEMRRELVEAQVKAEALREKLILINLEGCEEEDSVHARY